MFFHENYASHGEDYVFHEIDTISSHVISSMEAGSLQTWVDRCWDLVEANSSRFREQGLQDLAMSVVAGELSRHNEFHVMLEELHRTSLENMREGSNSWLVVLKEVVQKLRALGLDGVVNTTSYEAIRKHLKVFCQDIIEESNGGTLQSVLMYMDSLNEYFFSVGMDKNDWLRQLGNPVFEVVQRQNIERLFDLVIDYPDSLPALDDLKECIKQTREYAVLIQDYGGAMQSRLLRPGASTLDIIQHYISTIKVLQYIEPSGYILDIICKPIQRYLRSRKDAIKNIVILLTDTEEDSLFLPSSQGLPTKFYDSEQKAFDSIGTWHPAPLEIVPKNAPVGVRRHLDTMSLLTDIYGTKELFLSAYRSMLGERLTHKLDFECDKELKTLELLKIRFGEAALQNAEIMMRDVNDSKRLNAVIRKMMPDTEWIRVLVTSDQYWPATGNFDFNLPDSVNSAIASFDKHYHSQKTPRTLRWKKSLGEVSLNVTIGGELVHFKVSPLQASIIMAFGEKNVFKSRALCDKFGISEQLLMQNAILWLNEGIISYNNERNEFRRNNAIVRPITAMDVEGDHQDDQALDTSMSYLEPFITGMLTNFDALPLERIHNMLKMFVTDPPYDRSIDDLSKFLSTLTDAIILEGKHYKLQKR